VGLFLDGRVGQYRPKPTAVIAWVAGAAVAQVAPFVYMPPLLGLLSAAAVYIGVRKLSAVTDLPL